MKESARERAKETLPLTRALIRKLSVIHKPLILTPMFKRFSLHCTLKKILNVKINYAKKWCIFRAPISFDQHVSKTFPVICDKNVYF